MTDSGQPPPPASPAAPPPSPPPEVEVSTRPRLSLLWLLPLVAALIVGWLGWQWLEDRGPQIVIIFQSGDGLEAGRTPIKLKNVNLGVIESVRLSDNLSQVIATARMDRTASQHLREGTRFWVVEPRLSLGGVSGLSTVVSGTYVEMEPGGGAERREFYALDEPPVVRADTPGRSFTLKAEQLGSLAQGSPVYFRGVQVGEVMGYNLSPQDRTVSVSIFVRAPYEGLVREGSRFWRSSGIQFTAGAEGLKFQMESLRALALGGVVLETPPDPEAGVQAKDWSTFTLYEDQAAAVAARDRLRVRYRLEFPGSVQGLQAGAPVLLRGLTVGHVAAVRLEYDEATQELRIPVFIDFEPELVVRTYDVQENRPLDEAAVRRLVATQVEKGLRGRLASGNLLTGQRLVFFDYAPDMPPALGPDRSELPTVASSDLDSIMASAGEVMDKISALPLDALIADLRGTLQSVSGLAGSPDLARSLAELAKALGSADALMRNANRQLPEVVRSLRGVATAAEGALNSANGLMTGSGGQPDLPEVLRQLNDAARSFRVLADYLERHPDALIWGKRR
ncbi:intermembrane transport protein PqiB [Azospirillum ramasamyi]|uniref:Paraquat-inducible protein B n=1 Tax=Azospirillum ramasamyi TaxID=682998 RepID=A0A2U9SF90_9PROT|nr:MlaD family protein [Azospirillum ramasamyi]AWU96438.1 paraquat-inducible protein B [Azospirillum ramasamyi]